MTDPTGLHPSLQHYTVLFLKLFADAVLERYHPPRQGETEIRSIFVYLSERAITRSEVILNAKVVGALQMVDHDEADDKIIAVLENDNVWGNAKDLSDLPDVMIERLRHYFLTYKLIPGEKPRTTIEKVLNLNEALEVVKAALDDYADEYGN